jgi:hypothetical protein
VLSIKLLGIWFDDYRFWWYNSSSTYIDT